MVTKLRGAASAGLERSCGATRSGWLRSRELSDGVQLLQAWFAGHGFDKHRHDTYAIGVTDVGVQAFDYRGVAEISTPGKVLVLHPDETHDGRAGAPDGFGYRIVYVAPARIHEAARAIPRARQFLDAETTRVIRSSELEAVTGLTRYDLARQFRSAFGTSPYRYSLLRRLDGARAQLRRNRSLADVALAAGFADQAHLTRMFKYTFGVTPARYRELI